ncbi:MAG: hypothetical protein ACPGF7_00515 [Pontibacterium sp.]
MDLIAFMSMIILVITILTLVFGVIAYFLYKIREQRNKQKDAVTYEGKLDELGTEYIFFEK